MPEHIQVKINHYTRTRKSHMWQITRQSYDTPMDSDTVHAHCSFQHQ